MEQEYRASYQLTAEEYRACIKYIDTRKPVMKIINTVLALFILADSVVALVRKQASAMHYVFLAVAVFYMGYLVYNYLIRPKKLAQKLSEKPIEIRLEPGLLTQAGNSEASITLAKNGKSIVKLQEDLWLVISSVSFLPIKPSAFENYDEAVALLENAEDPEDSDFSEDVPEDVIEAVPEIAKETPKPEEAQESAEAESEE